MTLILGIDPGSRITGYGLITEHSGDQTREVVSGCIRVGHLSGLTDRLKRIYSEISCLIDQYQPQEVAVEDVFFSHSPRSALWLGHARAAAMLAAANCDLPIFEYQARKIKKTVSGSGQSAKTQMQLMVRMLLQVDRPLQEDAADALAVAICHSRHRGTESYRQYLEAPEKGRSSRPVKIRRGRIS